MKKMQPPLFQEPVLQRAIEEFNKHSHARPDPERARLVALKDAEQAAIERVSAPLDKFYGELIERLTKELAEIKGSEVTHAVLVWYPGKWDERVTFYEGDEKHCKRHLAHLRGNRKLIPEQWRDALCEIRPIELIPMFTAKIEGPEPLAFDSAEWSRQLRERQAAERDRERRQVVVDLDY